MYIVHVFVQVKAEYIEPFMAATLENAKASRQEPGIARFDVLQEENNPDCFVLVEVYRTKDDPARHKETAHYQQWRTAVDVMCVEPRTKKVYTNVFPGEVDWD